MIRQHQAEIVFTPCLPDAHPDHTATTRIVEDARFDAKLTKTDLPGDPIYPRWLFYYYCTHLRTIPQPSFLLDITGYEDRKRQAMLAYDSQFVQPTKNRRIVEWLDAAGTYFGSRIGVKVAEPFFTKEPLGLTGLRRRNWALRLDIRNFVIYRSEGQVIKTPAWPESEFGQPVIVLRKELAWRCLDGSTALNRSRSISGDQIESAIGVQLLDNSSDTHYRGIPC